MAYMREWLIFNSANIRFTKEISKYTAGFREEKCVLRNKTSDFAHCTLGERIILRVLLEKFRSILIENAPGNGTECL